LLSVFAKLLLISSMIAVPITYFLTSRWLERFVYQTPLSPVVFLASLLAIAVITLFTVGFETWRAAQANPVESLRHE
jgi:putative ABC transport system permease protein